MVPVASSGALATRCSKPVVFDSIRRVWFSRSRLQVPFLDLAGMRITADWTAIWEWSDPSCRNTIPLALSKKLLDPMTLEMDFPNARYRLVR